MNKRQCFLPNTNAVAEEFTTLPALMIVVIGFIIAFVLIGNSYKGFQDQSGTLDALHTTEQLYHQIMNPNNDFISDAGIIDYTKLHSPHSQQFFSDLQSQYNSVGHNFSLLITFHNHSLWYPSNEGKRNQQFAVSHPVSIEVNPVNIYPATITFIIWDTEDEIP